MKKIIRQLGLVTLAILTTLNLLSATAKYDGIHSDETVKANQAAENLCLTENDMANITAVIEEPLDFGTLSNDEEKVRNCVRVSVCKSIQEDATKAKTECISTLNSKEGVAKIKSTMDNLNKSEWSVTYTPVQVFISQSGVDMLYLYIGAIYRWGASIIGIIAVLVIVISGIQISAAGGEQAAVTSAKTRIAQSLIGIVILFLSGIILYTINPTFFTAQ